MKALPLVGLFALFMSPLQAQEQKDVAVTTLLSTTRTSSGQPIGLPPKNAKIVASVYDVASGAALPVHNHPYPRYGYVLAGLLRVTNIDTGETNTYKPGSFFLEPIGQWHIGASIGREPLRLLVIDVAVEGQTNLVFP
jgi:quercetin dioxygenase-like cupin family protein